MAKDVTYDVLVVGARCAGASVAMLLARRGLRVLVVDRAACGSDTVSTHALMRPAVMQLQRWGVLPVIVRRGTPPVRTTTFHYGDEVIEVGIRPSHGVSELYAPRRTLLDAALVDAARASGAEVRHGVRLVSLLRREDGRVMGAVVTDSTSRPLIIHAGMVIGADGISSTVARLAGASFTHRARHSCAAVFGYFTGLRPDGYHWYYNPGVSAGVIPTNDDQSCIFAAMPADRFRGTVRHDIHAGFHQVVREASSGLARAVSECDPTRDLQVFAGQSGYMRQAVGPGWALVGDAGYFKDPLTAHGITDAFRDAELLANAVARGTDAALAGYAVTRDTLSLPLFAASDAIASFRWDLDTVRPHHQTLNTAMKHEAEMLAGMASPDTFSGYAGHPSVPNEKAA